MNNLCQIKPEISFFNDRVEINEVNQQLRLVSFLPSHTKTQTQNFHELTNCEWSFSESFIPILKIEWE